MSGIEPRTVCISGLGYIGLPTACVLASHGFQVAGVDTNQERVNDLAHGVCPIQEPELDGLARYALKAGRLTLAEAPQPSDVFMICVPTPFKEGHKPDLSFVEAAAARIAPALAPGNLVILESTAPVGATEQVAETLAKLRPDLRIGEKAPGAQEQVYVAYCPERVLPGRILKELVENDRIVGGIDKPSTRKGIDFYEKFVSGHVRGASSRTAEMVKLAENSYRDVNVAFANELSMICDELGIDALEVIELANQHPRVNVLKPGPGVGGHCIAVDPWFIVDAAPERARLIHAARDVNDSKPAHVLDKVRKLLSDSSKIAVLGLAFKPDVDDLRESPSLAIAAQLAGEGAELLVCEPHVSELPAALAASGRARLVELDDAMRQADVILALVAHREFKGIAPEALAGKRVVDACGLWPCVKGRRDAA